jgi:hypothetical protein
MGGNPRLSISRVIKSEALFREIATARDRDMACNEVLAVYRGFEKAPKPGTT